MAIEGINITKRYPLELHYIKALCVQAQYRQCIQACRDLLKRPGDSSEEDSIRQTFISFYLGLAHDELARLMHDYSQAKIPAFLQAEQFYKEALDALRKPGVLLEVARPDSQSSEGDPFFDGSSDNSEEQTPHPAGDDEYDPYNFSSPTFPTMPPMSPPTFTRTDSLPVRSPPTSARDTSSSTLTDLESHSSFDQIMTPHKVLERDISRMSLLDDAPNKQPSLPRTTSVTHGLLRPIRMGSPPKAYHVPPRLPYVGNMPGKISRLPKLATRSMQESPTWRGLPRRIDEESSPVSPVSPLRREEIASEGSTTSPISPVTPEDSEDFEEESSTPLETAVPHDDPFDHSGNKINEHLDAFRIQLETHLTLLERAKQATIAVQSARSAGRASAAPTKPAPTTGTPLAPLRASLDGSLSSRPGSSSSKHDSVMGEGKRLPQTRSYWSFTPVDQKAQEKQKRIQAGRERRWAKERFRPERYRKLAEKALAEL